MKDDKPTPLQDVRKGLGLLFRAAKTAVEKWPARGGVEEVVATSAREVGRALENVASTIEREVFKRGRQGKPVDGDKPTPPDDAADKPKPPEPG